VTVTAPHAAPSHSLGSGALPVDISSGFALRTEPSGLTIGVGVLSAAEATAGAGAGGDPPGAVAACAEAGCDFGDEPQADSVSTAAHTMIARMYPLGQ
jgi:hypothetical protein